MKTKTIKKVIDKKISEWIDSIEDENVKKACRRDVIVTGGCIASMLSREPVNDFDIYFKTAETVKMVSEYYVTQVDKLYVNNISDSRIQVIDSEDIPESRWNEDSPDRSKWDFFVRGLKEGKEKRIKLYIPHIGYWRRTDNTYSSDVEEVKENTFQPIYLSENAITLSDQIQLVIRFFGEAEVIHENYDFVHATNYFHYEEGKPSLVLRSEALTSLLTKELQYIGSKYPLTSIIRTKKFLNRGFTVSAGTYLKMIWQCGELDLKNPVVLQEQLIGVDVAYFSLLLDAISNIDPEKLNYNFISTIIERVFDNVETED